MQMGREYVWMEQSGGMSHGQTVQYRNIWGGGIFGLKMSEGLSRGTSGFLCQITSL